jgi:hypothetical protein
VPAGWGCWLVGCSWLLEHWVAPCSRHPLLTRLSGCRPACSLPADPEVSPTVPSPRCHAPSPPPPPCRRWWRARPRRWP